MNNQKEIEIIDKNIILSILFVISIIISILISYNQKLEKEKRDLLFDIKTSKTLNTSNRVFALLLVIGFLIINYQEYEIGKSKNRNIKPLEHQLWASGLSIASAIIALYVVLENIDQNFQVYSIENPII